MGNWNGFGGKVETGETIAAAAARELAEEASVELVEAHLQGKLFFTFATNPQELEVHVFHVTKFSGTPRESEEMSPRWFTLDQIPYDAMWADDRQWLPLFLAGTYFRGTFHFADASRLARSDVVALPSADGLI